MEPSGEIATAPIRWPRLNPLSTSSTWALAEAFCAVDGIPDIKVAMHITGAAMRRKGERISIPFIAKC
jgi:hypothetical protein